MRHVLQRHPIPMRARLEHSLVLSYAYPRHRLEALLPPGLTLDTFGDLGFVAIALVQTRGMRPAFMPHWLGRDFFLAGIRIFVKHRDASGRTRRGLHILRSFADSSVMVNVGNLLTHYNYQLMRGSLYEHDGTLDVEVVDSVGQVLLSVAATVGDVDRGDVDGRDVDGGNRDTALPAQSPFATIAQARRYAGPLPYTFDHEPQTHSIIRIKGVRDSWEPRAIAADVRCNRLLDHTPLKGIEPMLANVFYVHNVEYRWERGIRESLSSSRVAARHDGNARIA